MISRMAGILRSTLPRTCTICRWGGDEFAVMLPGADRSDIDNYIAKLMAAGQKYNANHPDLPIHFSVGASLSTEHPGTSREDLFYLADKDMYRSKQQWYATQREEDI